MPVVFAPPDPFNPYVSAGIGAQERQDKERHTADQEWAQAAAIQQRQQQLEQQQRHQDLQAQMAQAEFNYADGQALQKAQQGLATIEADWRDGNISDDDFAKARQQAMARIDPLVARQKGTEEKTKQAQMEHVKLQNQQLATGDAAYQNFMAKAGVNGITTVPDPDNQGDVLRDRATGEPLHFQWSHKAGQMIPLEKPTSSARVPSHAGWTDKQIDDAAHARAVQSRPEWQSNPQAAKAHPDYVDEYAKHRSNVLTSLYYGETTEPDENGDRKQKKANGEWAPVEGSKATIAAAKPQKPAPAERAPQFVEEAERKAAIASVLAGNPAWAGQSAAHLADNKDFNQQVAAEFAAREQLHGQRMAEWRRKQPGGQPAAPTAAPTAAATAAAEAAQGPPAPTPIPPPPAGAGTEADVDAAIKRAKAKAAPNQSEYDTPVRWQ